VDRLVEEIHLRGREIPDGIMDTLYFGGGTPSVLKPGQMEKILDAIHHCFDFRPEPEITIEGNPDDLNHEYLDYLKNSGFNRISMGVQSFLEKDLQLMRRSHNREQAIKSVEAAAKAGFENITVDLIYGISGQTISEWESNIEITLSLPVSHVSAYHLTYEPGTVFDHWRKNERLIPIHEEQSVERYAMLRRILISEGFDHYEISNFAKTGKLSEHNLVYWTGKPYLGFGPSAHSFVGEARSWNVSSLKGYMDGIAQKRKISETESLTNKEKYHDYLITSLRTKWGADPEIIQQQFGPDVRKHFDSKSLNFVKEGSMQIFDKTRAIHPDSWLITDHILRALFLD
jgi:oxygen-independent coproporphyrinogen-3 oxidase